MQSWMEADVCDGVQEEKQNRNVTAVGAYQMEVETSALV